MSRNFNKYGQKGNWRPNSAQQNLRAGVCGLFFTVDGEEKRAVKEARNIIDHFLEVSRKKNAEEPKNDEGSEQIGQLPNEDISDSLSNECRQLGQQQSAQQRNSGAQSSLRQMETGARCMLFFTSPDISAQNVYELADQMAEDCQTNARTRFLAKVLPVEETCAAYMDQIVPALDAMLARHWSADASDAADAAEPRTYAIDFRASNTKLLKREQVYEAVNALVKQHSPEASVNLTQPDFSIVVHLIRSVALLSILRNFHQKGKLALRKPQKATGEGGDPPEMDDQSDKQQQEAGESGEKNGGEEAEM